MGTIGIDLALRQRRAGGLAALFIGVQGAWYDPSDLASMAQDMAGAVAAAVDQPVGRIADKSGNGRHATQASADARPMLRQDGGGRLYLEFDGTTQFLSAAYEQAAYPLTLALAARLTTAAAGALISVTSSDAIYKKLGDHSVAAFANATDRNASLTHASAAAAAGSNHVMIAELGAAQVALQVDGGAVVTAAHSNAFGSATTLFLGKTRASGLFAGGRIYAAIAMARLAGGDRALLKARLDVAAGLAG